MHDNKLSFKFLKQDLPSGLVVFLVALPLCLGIALASGAPLFSGLIAGIVGGILIGMLSDSPLSVSGPAAGLAALVFGAITSIGDYSLFLCAVLIAGLLQIVMSVARLGGIANYIPSSVIKGMLTSIGILIFAKQIPHALGYDKDDKGKLEELMPFGDVHELFSPVNHIHLGVTILTIISLFILIFWDKSPLKKKMPLIPGALVAVVIAVVVNIIWQNFYPVMAVENEHLVSVPVATSASEFIGFFTLPNFSGFTNANVLMYGFIIAIIASLETLLSIEAIDNLDPERRVTNTNRELFAQGLGNAVSGLIGGLPITSVIVRSSANVNAGAKTKLSAIFHAILLLLCVIAIPFVLNKIPLAALASILLLTGYKLAKPSFFKQMYASGKYQFIPFIVTVLVILLIDLFKVIPVLSGKGLIIGVLAGIVAAIGALLHANLKNSHFFTQDKDASHENTFCMKLAEEVSFLNKAKIRQTLDDVVENSSIKIDASHTQYIDFDVLEIIREFKNIKAPLKNIKCELVGFKEVYSISPIA